MFINNSPKKIKVQGYKRDDCTVRAIGNALGLSYDLSRKILQVGCYYNEQFSFLKKGPLTKLEFTSQPHVEKICGALSAKTIQFERSGAKPRTKLRDFAKDYNKGIYIVLVDRHLTVVMDGNVVDSWDCNDRNVVAAYRIDLKKSYDTIRDLAKFYKMHSTEHYVKGNKKKILDKEYTVAGKKKEVVRIIDEMLAV